MARFANRWLASVLLMLTLLTALTGCNPKNMGNSPLESNGLNSTSAPKTVSVIPGWDIFPQLTTGSVKYQQPGNSGLFKITYSLTGAEPNQTYVVGFDIFNLPEPGVAAFGVARYTRGNYTREGVNATVDVFGITASPFTTDGAGNGTVSVTLDVQTLPAGAYPLQFWWSRLGEYPIFYQTGQKYGIGFETITIP